MSIIKVPHKIRTCTVQLPNVVQAQKFYFVDNADRVFMSMGLMHKYNWMVFEWRKFRTQIRPVNFAYAVSPNQAGNECTFMLQYRRKGLVYYPCERDWDELAIPLTSLNDLSFSNFFLRKMEDINARFAATQIETETAPCPVLA